MKLLILEAFIYHVGNFARSCDALVLILIYSDGHSDNCCLHSKRATSFKTINIGI